MTKMKLLIGDLIVTIVKSDSGYTASIIWHNCPLTAVGNTAYSAAVNVAELFRLCQNSGMSEE